jgi:hypothetical protein
MNDIEVYIDDIGIWGAIDWDQHCVIIAKVLHPLKINGFTVNPFKCEWAVKETDWLGYWLTPEGLKHGRKRLRQYFTCNRLSM